MANLNLYEINTRVWLRRFDTENKKACLDDVPLLYWESLAEKGMDFIWLMGIWKICESTVEKYCLQEGPVKDSFSTVLEDFEPKDVIGSPYAVDRYEVNPNIGNLESLEHVRSILHNLGIKLILDFVPNHFSAHSSLIQTDPYIFLEADKDFLTHDSISFYKPFTNKNLILAHGRDPFFPAWEDTVQVNYFNPDARKFMIKTLIELSRICDGVRCDVAMLPLNEVFQGTWGNVLSSGNFKAPQDEFWKSAVDTVRNVCPDFTFIAEVYWDKEWELQQMGFDYTYDKRLTDRLKANNVKDILEHLMAENGFQKKSMRFLENHDEERAVKAFGEEKSKAAAIIISTLQGMHLYNDGQFEGKKIRLPVQLGREPVEAVNDDIYNFYEKLLNITRNDVFKKGEWHLLKTFPAWESSNSFQNILAWIWTYGKEKRLIAVNYSDTDSACFLKPDIQDAPDNFTITDLLNNHTYIRSKKEINQSGLYIALKSWQSHIFSW